jgi:hypothetical protein
MAQENLISLELTPDDWAIIDQALAAILAIIIGKMINLTPDERHAHARVADEMANWIKKVKEYMTQNPQFVMSHIDTVEFNKDYAVREDMLPRYRLVQQIFSLFDDTNLLLGTDLYHNAIAFYKGLRSFAQTDAPGAKVIYEDLATQFPGRRRKTNPA